MALLEKNPGKLRFRSFLHTFFLGSIFLYCQLPFTVHSNWRYFFLFAIQFWMLWKCFPIFLIVRRCPLWPYLTKWVSSPDPIQDFHMLKFRHVRTETHQNCKNPPKIIYLNPPFTFIVLKDFYSINRTYERQDLKKRNYYLKYLACFRIYLVYVFNFNNSAQNVRYDR